MNCARWPKLLVLLLVVLAISSPVPAEEAASAYDGPREKLHVYLLIGQSNMAGRAPFSEDESGVIERCYLLNGEDRWEPARNPLNRYSTIRKGLGMQKLNPGYTFANAMLAADEEISIGLVVNAKGGSSIEQWGRETRFYSEAVRRAKKAQETGVLKGVLWHQGESNAKNPDGYLEKLEGLVAALRADLDLADLPFVAGQVHDVPAINARIAELPGRVPVTGCVSSEGLTTQDRWHFDAPGMKLLGRRYAEKMRELQSAGEASATTDLERIRRQYLESILGSVNVKKVEADMRALREDGTWPDINYRDTKRSGWEPRRHVQRIREMARAYRRPGSPLEGREEVREAILRALGHYLSKGYRCRNWWYNKIGVPDVMADILVLMDDLLPKEMADLAIEKVVSQAKIGMTGQNKVWLARIVFVCSLFEGDEQQLARARDVILGEIRVTTKEGIQPDWSFHQHGPQQQFGNYGSAFASTVTGWGMVLRGTSLALADRKLEIIRNYILEGENWVIWRGRLDLSACGRQVGRDCQKRKGRWVLGRLGRMVSLDPAHREVYERRLAAIGTDGKNDLIGTRQFWRSDMMVHRRADWYASIKMSSERVIGAETCNSENMLGLHLGDGALFVYRTGDEYENIQPVWDWHRLPGTTCDRSIARLVPSGRACRPPVSFVGGVSDRETGVAVFDFRRGTLAARKAWFFEDDRIVCLGAGITATGGGPILTSIQQSLLQGEVVGEGGAIGPGTHELAPGAWVYHAGIAYHIIEAAAPVLRIASQTGNWRRIFTTRGEEKEISRDVFSLWLDHGTTPEGDGYAYVIYPEAAPSEMPAFCRDGDLEILSNTAALQAIALDGGARVRAAFYEPGALAYGDGRRIETDTPCLVTVDRTRGTIFLADPTQKQTRIHLEIDGRSQTVDLPAGGEAGRSVEVAARQGAVGSVRSKLTLPSSLRQLNPSG